MASQHVQIAIPNSSLRAGRDNNIANTYNNYGSHVEDPLVNLKQHSALGALHNAAERPDPPKCHPKTRTAVLDCIDRWARDRSSAAKSILWLSGAAGAGKSAIAQTLIERWLEENFACPNFFFWRTSGKRNTKTYLVPTIAFQLMKMLPATESDILKAVSDGSVFEQNLEAQVQHLLVAPLSAVQEGGGLIIVIIDGLDECCIDLPKADGFPGQSYEDQQREILDALGLACQKLPSLRVLVASRPEREIRSSFTGDILGAYSYFLSLNNEPDAAADITLYLVCKFAEIRSRYEGLDSSWPSQGQICELVEKSSGQFVYPSTVIKYISRRRQYPVQSLKEILALQPKPGHRKVHPLAELDALYILVLRTVHAESLSTVKLLLGMMCYLSAEVASGSSPGQRLPSIFREITAGYNTSYLSRFLFSTEGELLAHLTDLHSVLAISKKGTHPKELTRIRFLHATLSECLRDPCRSEEFFVHEDEINLQCSLLLLRHAHIARSRQGDTYFLHEPELFSALANFLHHCPPSIDHMKELWAIVKDDIGEYSLILSLNTRSVKFRSNYLVQPCIDGPVFEHIESKDQLKILQYLQKCNIAEIEPSDLLRQATAKYLTPFINYLKGASKTIPGTLIRNAANSESNQNSGEGQDEGFQKFLAGEMWPSVDEDVTDLLRHAQKGSESSGGELPHGELPSVKLDHHTTMKAAKVPTTSGHASNFFVRLFGRRSRRKRDATMA